MCLFVSLEFVRYSKLVYHANSDSMLTEVSLIENHIKATVAAHTVLQWKIYMHDAPTPGNREQLAID